MEMVIFLNSLYKMFDARIDKYDVYKVQAINDSFMLASGIPTQVKAKVYSWLYRTTRDLEILALVAGLCGPW